MAISDGYTVQVCNLSPKAAIKDVQQFFSYSGTVKNVKLQRAGQWAQVSFVTFQEPYALETAVLLSGATILNQQVYIVPWGGSEEAVNRWKKHMMKFHEEGNTLGAAEMVTTMLSKGYTLGKDTLTKAKELDEKYQVMDNAAAKVADFGKFFGEISKSAFVAAGHAACNAGTAAVNSRYFATGALMVAGVLDRAAKVATDFGNRNNAVKK